MSSCNPIGYDAGHTCGMRQLLLPSPSLLPTPRSSFFLLDDDDDEEDEETLRPVRWNHLHLNLFINCLFKIYINAILTV